MGIRLRGDFPLVADYSYEDVRWHRYGYETANTIITRTPFSEDIQAHILCAVCGLVPDIELLLSYARQEVLRYRLTRNAEIPVIKLVQRLADVSQEYTRHKTLRPLSVGMTFGGYTDAEGFQLLSLEVATVMHWKATAYGHNHLSLRRFLESGFSEGITSKKAAELAYETFVKVSECTSPSQLQVVTLRKSSSAGASPIEMEFLSTDKFKQLVGYNPSTEDNLSDNEISS
ncbi:hypothetical protein NM208_g14541 [Fusarium decemcellulare]|uniref:Uncharacterized protein n=1 Tax=Fusarium decemcellulare TaxID=57161 RepID=A0ACC1RFP3_9HYPO|nr:hypothetical protein NM208_g14541 [Fusarium decemcellulare]